MTPTARWQRFWALRGLLLALACSSGPDSTSGGDEGEDANLTSCTAPANTTAPSISGSATVASSLTGHPGTWSGTTPLSNTDYWQRCDSSSNCPIIPSGSATAFVVQSADLGFALTLSVKAVNAWGATWSR